METQKSHPREWVDCSHPAYITSGLLNIRIPPTEVGGWFRSNLLVHIEVPVKLNSFLNALGRFVSEAGSEQSTNFRWWDSRTRLRAACRSDLNYPPTPWVGFQHLWSFEWKNCA